MSSLTSLSNFTAQMSMSMQEATRQLMQEVQQNADRLDRKKASIAETGLERMQASTRIAEGLAEARSKIDVYV
jgi:trans-aconitate methyltransferase